MAPKESVLFEFRAVKTSTDIELSVDSDKPVRWSAPSLATPSISRVTFRVDEFGTVTMTVEKSWAERLADWLK